MPIFIYTAQDEKGKNIQGQAESPTEIEAITQIQRKGLLVLAIRQDNSSSAEVSQKKKGSFVLFQPSVAAADLIFVAEQLALLLKGGVPLLQGLKLLGQNVSNPVLMEAIVKISDDVAAGSSFRAALARHPKVFPPIFRSMVEAGEASGQLPKTLEEVSNYLNQRDALRGKVITALMYPGILIGMSVFVLAFFIIRIVPVFSTIFSSFNMKLPPMTIAVIAVSNAFANNLLIIIALCVAVFFGGRAYFKTEPGQWALGRFLLKIPMFGNFILNLLVEQFLVNFALLLKSGVDVLNALAILEKLLEGNKPFSNAVAVSREKIKSGGTIAQGFSQTKVFPNLVQQMMAMGEEAGRLPEILEALAAYYRRQIEQFVARLSAVIDPIMVVGVAGIVMVIVLAVFMPIFELTQVGTH